MGFLHKNRYAVSPYKLSFDLYAPDSASFCFVKPPSATCDTSKRTIHSSMFTLSFRNRSPISLEEEWDISVANDMGFHFLLRPQEETVIDAYDDQTKTSLKTSFAKEENLDAPFLRGSEMLEIFRMCRIDVTISSLFFRPSLSLCLGNISKLDLSFNGLTSILDSFGFYFPCLKYLSLEGNCLSKLPASICTLSSMTTLIVDNNQLQYLPESLGALMNLKILSCKSNLLTFLPDSILGPLSLLLQLEISENPITFIPPFLLWGKNIKVVCKNCPFLTSKALYALPPVLYDHHFNEKWMRSSDILQRRDGPTDTAAIFSKGGIVFRTIFSAIKEYFDLPDVLSGESEQHLPNGPGQLPLNLVSYFASDYEGINIFSMRTHPPVYNDSFEVQSDDSGYMFSYPRKKNQAHPSKKSIDGFFFKIPTLKEFAARAAYAQIIDIPCDLPLLLRAFLRGSHPCSHCGGVYFDSWTPRFFRSKFSSYYIEGHGDDGGSELDGEYVSLVKMCWPHWGDRQSRLESTFSYSKMAQFTPSPAYGFRSFNVIDFWIRSISLNNPSFEINRKRSHMMLWRHLKRTKAFATFERRFYNGYLCGKAFLFDPYIMCNFLFPISSSFVFNRLSLCKIIEERHRFFTSLRNQDHLDRRISSLIGL